MNKFMKTKALCWGVLGAFTLMACSEDSATAQNFGTTEEKNAFWDESSNLVAWNVMNGSDIKLENSKSALLGKVKLKSSSKDLARAGIALNVSNPDGTPSDLSQGNDGLCIAYQSDFEVEVRLDTEDYANSSVDKDLPYVSLNMKDGGDESRCATWKDFKTKKSDKIDGSDAAKKVRSVQLVFVGESGSSGEFSIQQLTPYVRSDLWIGKSDGARVETGFAKGDEGTSTELTFFEDSSKAYFEWDYTYDYTDLAERIEYNEGIYGNVVFKGSSSDPDIGVEFLVAGKTTKKGKDFIYTADVSNLWKGMCLEYESQMDIVMELVPGDSSKGTLEKKTKTMTFAKNNDMEKSCIVFANVLGNSDDILKHLAKIRLKLAKKDKAGTAVGIRRISALVPEDLSVKESGDFTEIKPTQSSKYKSGKSFLWDGSVDGDRVDLGISGATAGGIWTNSPEETDMYSFNFPDDVKADDDGYVIASMVSKYHNFQGYVKSSEDDDDIATIGFNTVSPKLEQADISAWNGFCIHYKVMSNVRITIVTDAAKNKYWYAEVDYADDMVWGKVSWNAFKNIDEKSSEKIEDVIGKISQVQLRFPYDGEFVVDKFGSYDQCGK